MAEPAAPDRRCPGTSATGRPCTCRCGHRFTGVRSRCEPCVWPIGGGQVNPWPGPGGKGHRGCAPDGPRAARPRAASAMPVCARPQRPCRHPRGPAGRTRHHRERLAAGALRQRPWRRRLSSGRTGDGPANQGGGRGRPRGRSRGPSRRTCQPWLAGAQHHAALVRPCQRTGRPRGRSHGRAGPTRRPTAPAGHRTRQPGPDHMRPGTGQAGAPAERPLCRLNRSVWPRHSRPWSWRAPRQP